MFRSDEWLQEKIANGEVVTAIARQTQDKIITTGITSYGYDVTLSDKIYTTEVAMIDPKNKGRELTPVQPHMHGDNKYFLMRPQSSVLVATNEIVSIPRDHVGLVFNKSTYVRCGITTPQTVLEPEWSGKITLLVINHNQSPVMVYLNEGFAQIMFVKTHETCRISYLDKKGKYQNAIGVQL